MENSPVTNMIIKRVQLLSTLATIILTLNRSDGEEWGVGAYPPENILRATPSIAPENLLL